MAANGILSGRNDRREGVDEMEEMEDVECVDLDVGSRHTPSLVGESPITWNDFLGERILTRSSVSHKSTEAAF